MKLSSVIILVCLSDSAGFKKGLNETSVAHSLLNNVLEAQHHPQHTLQLLPVRSTFGQVTNRLRMTANHGEPDE